MLKSHRWAFSSGCRSDGKQARGRSFCIRAVAEALEPRMLLSTYFVTSSDDPSTLTAGTLRWAVQQANTNPGDDTIVLASSLSGTLTLQRRVLELSDASGKTTIIGPGAGVLAINGNNLSRVFLIDAGVTASINGLTITGGNAGGGNGGGIFNSGTLTLANSTLSGDKASLGGGIYNSFGGTCIIAGSTLSGDSTNSGKVGYYGGGVDNNDGTLTITNSTFSDDSAFGDGGGIYNYIGSCTVASSTFSGDSASNGGGIFNDTSCIISDSTLSGDTANNGGGIYNLNACTLSNCTVSVNLTNMNGGGIANGNTGTVTLHNSIVAGNLNILTATPSDIYGISGTISGSNNLIGTGGSGGLVNGFNGNVVGVANAMLGLLQNNGGPTQTMAELAGSPAIGGGTSIGAPPTDQRGVPRGSPPDIGAFELVSANETYVVQIYSDILHRVADAGGLAYWTAQLNGGAPRQSVALGLSSSLEYYDDVVNSYYELYLGRAADTAGINHWAGLMVQGASAEAIRVDIVSSAEYYNDGGGTVAGYVTELYNALLGRAPDGAGLTGWEGVLASSGAAAVAGGFIYSLEYYGDVIAGFYQTYLHRAADSGGLNNWVNALLGGEPEQSIIASFVSSAEYLGLYHIA